MINSGCKVLFCFENPLTGRCHGAFPRDIAGRLVTMGFSFCLVSTFTINSTPLCRKFDFFPKGTAGADGWMSLYFKFADQFSDNQQIGFGFKLHVINFQFPSQTLTKGMRSNSCCLLVGELLNPSCISSTWSKSSACCRILLDKVLTHFSALHCLECAPRLNLSMWSRAHCFCNKIAVQPSCRCQMLRQSNGSTALCIYVCHCHL